MCQEAVTGFWLNQKLFRLNPSILALYLSDKEEATLTSIAHYIEQEYQANIDQFTQNVIISQLELLLNYAERFYHRQFITRKVQHHEILARLS